MNAIRFVLVLSAFASVVALAFVEMAEAKTRPHRRHVSDRYERRHYEDRRHRTSPRAEDFQRDLPSRRGSEWNTSCFNLPYLLQQHACSTGGGDGL
jgi:hypothetical protein